MPRTVSNKRIERVQFKIDLPIETRDKLKEASLATGHSMALIVTMLVKYHLSSIDMEANIRKSLAEYARKNKQELKLSKRQQRIIEDGSPDRHYFTKDLI